MTSSSSFSALGFQACGKRELGQRLGRNSFGRGLISSLHYKAGQAGLLLGKGREILMTAVKIAGQSLYQAGADGKVEIIPCGEGQS